jgi:hypothetical protein
MLRRIARGLRRHLMALFGLDVVVDLKAVAVHRELDRLRALPANNRPGSLVPHGAKVYSQNDEDGIIAEIFERIGVSHHVFVEIGVEAGLQNNTLVLLMQGWRGTWFEGRAAYVKRIERGFPAAVASGQLQAVQAMVTPQNVDELMTAARVPAEIDLLSIDIDGHDLDVMEALTVVQPRVVVMEYNAKYPPPMHYRLGERPGWWNRDDAFGASLSAIEASLSARGYALVGCNVTGCNAFFVRADLVGDAFQQPFDAPTHFQPARQHLANFPQGHPPSYAALETRRLE